LALSEVRIVENELSGATVEAVFAPASAPASGAAAVVRFRLTTGEAILTAVPGQGVEKLDVRARASYVVVPDFFADDAVYAARALGGQRVGLPVENSFLALLEGEDSLLMCIWRSNERAVDATCTAVGPGPAASCQLRCTGGEEVWLALLEEPGIWHAESLAGTEPEGSITLQWQPPFPAKWRGSFVGERGTAVSRDFGEPNEETMRAAPWGCWFTDEGAVVRPPGPEEAEADLLVIYPLDRSRSTPLTTFCPIDVMRNTLGVGPCQYVLAVEGLGAEADPTPAEVTQWVERLLLHKRAERQADAVRERLAQMTAHLGHVLARIEAYDAFAAEVEHLCTEAAASEGAEGPRRVARDLRRAIARGREHMGTPAEAAALADAMAALIGREDAHVKSQPLGEKLRGIGAAQDATLARCRMAARRMREIARTAPGREPGAAGLAAEVQARAEAMLRRK
ncbi:MAG: hypothetical protein AMK73_04570, partial [Planctomycetes bacterium SM23_32]